MTTWSHLLDPRELEQTYWAAEETKPIMCDHRDSPQRVALQFMMQLQDKSSIGQSSLTGNSQQSYNSIGSLGSCTFSVGRHASIGSFGSDIFSTREMLDTLPALSRTCSIDRNTSIGCLGTVPINTRDLRRDNNPAKSKVNSIGYSADPYSTRGLPDLNLFQTGDYLEVADLVERGNLSSVDFAAGIGIFEPTTTARLSKHLKSACDESHGWRETKLSHVEENVNIDQPKAQVSNTQKPPRRPSDLASSGENPRWPAFCGC